jgi:hypothetical protein
MKSIQSKYPDKTVPDAYHGTSKDNAEKIEKEGFNPSTGEDDFLGNGVYFFESSEWHAKNWARRRHKDIGVIIAEIRLGNCLELNNKEHRDLIRETAVGLVKSGYKDITDTVVINFITVKWPSMIDTVRASYLGPKFQHAKKIFPGSRFYDFQQLMICVKNLNNIISYDIAYVGR